MTTLVNAKRRTSMTKIYNKIKTWLTTICVGAFVIGVYLYLCLAAIIVMGVVISAIPALAWLITKSMLVCCAIAILELFVILRYFTK